MKQASILCGLAIAMLAYTFAAAIELKVQAPNVEVRVPEIDVDVRTPVGDVEVRTPEIDIEIDHPPAPTPPITPSPLNPIEGPGTPGPIHDAIKALSPFEMNLLRRNCRAVLDAVKRIPGLYPHATVVVCRIVEADFNPL